MYVYSLVVWYASRTKAHLLGKDLAQEGLLFDADFQRYLAYLHGYWTKPEYACHLAYPYCLSLLKLLQDPVFCQACVSADTATLLHRKEYAEWTAGQKRLQRLVGSIPDVVESEDSAMAPIPNEPPSAL